MTLDDFWNLIHRSATELNGHDRAAWLTEHLARLSVEQIIAFELHLTAQRRRVDTRLMWGAAWHIMHGWCSDDSFWYFQSWLVGLGREALDQVVAHPDALARLQQVRRLAGRATSEWSDDEWPEWELLNYVALNAYQRATGQAEGLDEALEAQGHPRICDASPQDEPWNNDDPDQCRTRFPRLTELLG